MLKRFSHLIAAAAAVMIVASPAAEAAERHGKGYYGRDGGRHVQRHRGEVRKSWRHAERRDWRHAKRKGWHREARRSWRHEARRGGHRYYRRHHGHRYYGPRHSYHYAGPAVIWRPRYRHHHYSGWHHDRHYRLAILFSVLETVRTGFTRHWQDPDSQTSGYVTPTRTYQLASGQYCREYQQQIIVGGRAVEGFGRACRQPDGSWRTVN